jgi:hypothetical protein
MGDSSVHIFNTLYLPVGDAVGKGFHSDESFLMSAATLSESHSD